jgi:hypothetical protein
MKANLKLIIQQYHVTGSPETSEFNAKLHGVAICNNTVAMFAEYIQLV